MGEPAQQLPFFVYGTLLPGQYNYGYWLGSVTEQKPARLHGGVLYDLGSYPMLIEAESGTVRGLLVHVDRAAYATILKGIDFLEGYDPAQANDGEYRRVRRVVYLTNGLPAAAWVYIGHPQHLNNTQSIGGDWKRHIRQRRDGVARRLQQSV